MEKETTTLVCVHLLNNYTGSPRVLSQLIRGLQRRGYTIHLLTSRGEGFLSDIPGVNYHYFTYNWTRNKALTIARYAWAQLKMFLMVLLRFRAPGVKLYINTLLPWGAALAGKLLGKEVIYHVHELFPDDKSSAKIYLRVFRHTVSKAVFVSDFLKQRYPDAGARYRTVHNALDDEFIRTMNGNTNGKTMKGSILMISSLKEYKGVYQFVELSRSMPHRRFELVLSVTASEVKWFERQARIPANLHVFATQAHIHPFYERASLVLNLTLPQLCVETFGLTILEAMAWGLPVIAPPVGGPVELVADGVNGFLADANDLPLLRELVERLLTDRTLYERMAHAALRKAAGYRLEQFVDQIEEVVGKPEKVRYLYESKINKLINTI